MENAKMKLLKEMKAENIIPPETLDEVAAGNCYEMADDSRFLNVLLRGHKDQPDRDGALSCWLMSEGVGNSLKAAWAAVGIAYMPSSSKSRNSLSQNAYILNGKTISREQAYQHAQDVIGKQLSESDWKW